MRRRLMVVAARLLMRLSPLIPMRFARGVGSLLGWVARVVAPRYRRMAAGHIAKAFPDLSDAERAHLLREVYRSAAQGAIEAAKANELSNERLKELVIVPDEERPRLEVAQKRGAGAIWVTPHMGPWELFPRYVIRCLGFRVVIIAKEQQGLEDLIGEMRRRAGVEILLKGDGGLRPLARALGEGAVVGALPDQSLRDASVPVEFFGHFALAHDGLSRLALLAKAPIFSMALLRRKSQPGEPSWGGYRYEIRLLDPVEPFDANGKRRSPEDVTRELANKMEELIRREPSQWMWFHDRWRVSGGSRQGQAQGRGRLGR